jgi:hypothetical protein
MQASQETESEFKTRQENLCALKLVASLKDRETFQCLEAFEVRGLSADRMAEPEQLGVNWTKDSTGVEGIWNEEEGKWEIEYLPKTLKFYPMGSFNEWVSSDEKGGKLITKKGAFKGTRGPSKGKFTRKCAVCRKASGKCAAARWFIVLDCGDWVCMGCVENTMYEAKHGEQPALSAQIGKVVELECSCEEVSEYVMGNPPSSPQENHQQVSSSDVVFSEELAETGQ